MKPTIPKGTRDFLPAQVYKRTYLFNKIEQIFKKFGYLAIETPTMENLSTLTGKYGEEGDRLVFKVLNNGDFLAGADEVALNGRDSKKIVHSISKRGLRYDLTVPFARYVVMHQNDIQFPFKRYQIQPVWRADRPQKGRYQEFYQCDADIIGSTSMMNEAELICLIDEVFISLGIDVSIKINNRKILMGIAEILEMENDFSSLTVAIDKLDKIGFEGVKREWIKRGFAIEKWERLYNILKTENIEELENLVADSELGLSGVKEIKQVLTYLQNHDLGAKMIIDFSLARGLNYYTGCIFEVIANHSSLQSSILGGGRYDDLTGIFGMPGMSGVGISFGAERIYDIMNELELFPPEIESHIQAIILAFDEQSHIYAFHLARELRNSNIAVSLYPDPVKIKKQMKFANAMKIPYAILIGTDEIASDTFSFKNLKTGLQEKLSLTEIKNRLID